MTPAPRGAVRQAPVRLLLYLRIAKPRSVSYRERAVARTAIGCACPCGRCGWDVRYIGSGGALGRVAQVCVTGLCGVALQLPTPVSTSAHWFSFGREATGSGEDIQPFKPPRRETISTPSRVFVRACSSRRRGGAFRASRTRACGTTAAAPCRAPSPRPASSCSRRACGC